MLSVRTSSIAQVLERLAALGASECALLTLALAYERALGKLYKRNKMPFNGIPSAHSIL